MSFPGESGGRQWWHRLRDGAGLRLPDPGRAIRELVTCRSQCCFGVSDRRYSARWLALWLASPRIFSESYENNVFAQIGLVMLIGMSAKNAILIVEFAKVEREKGKEPVEAALEAARQRFRPILMTAASFMLGVLPLLFATGAGAEARKVMGMTVFGGMLVATAVGILVVPALFVFIERYVARSDTPTPEPATPAETTESSDGVS